jgi:hypothetical protein
VPEPVGIDPQTHETCVLARQRVYERLKALLALADYVPDEAATSRAYGKFERLRVADNAAGRFGHSGRSRIRSKWSIVA